MSYFIQKYGDLALVGVQLFVAIAYCAAMWTAASAVLKIIILVVNNP